MNFANEKKQALLKIMDGDKSKKGSVDEEIRELIDLINQNDDYYTTSSCAGRIMLLSYGSSGKKHDVDWILSSHSLVDFNMIKESLDVLPKETVWFRMEPPILHICAKNMDAAEVLLKAANDAGFRRSCLLSFKKRIICEIMFPEKMDVPVSENNEMLVTDDYVKKLIEHANSRLSESRKKLKKLEEMFSSLNQENK